VKLRLSLVFGIAAVAICLAQVAPVAAQDPPGHPGWWGSEEGYTISGAWDITWDANGDVSNVELDKNQSSKSWNPGTPGGGPYTWHDDWWGANWDNQNRKLTLAIANDYASWLQKEVWVYWEYGGTTAMKINDAALYAYADQTEQHPIQDVSLKKGSVTYQNGYGSGMKDWVVIPQPEWEKIVWTVPVGDTIGDKSRGEKLYIGTHCTPEVSTWLLLLSTAFLGQSLRRRRKQCSTERTH